MRVECLLLPSVATFEHRFGGLILSAKLCIHVAQSQLFLFYTNDWIRRVQVAY